MAVTALEGAAVGVTEACPISHRPPIALDSSPIGLCPSPLVISLLRYGAGLLLALLLWVSPTSRAAELPEDRLDVLYHAYDGGGVTIDGPSLLVRKSVKEKVSLSAHYYVDLVSSASIDVLTQGSPYSEQRVEYGVGVDYLADRTVLSLNYTHSDEDDYEAHSVAVGVSQTFFGDLTTLSLGYSHGDDTVRKNTDAGSIEEETFAEPLLRRRFRLGLSQVLTRNWIIAFNAEAVIDDGFLNNPYRSVRYLQADGISEGWQPENYPTTRNSDAVSLRSLYYLPYRAALRVEARAFSDTWGIRAHNIELGYIHPLRPDLTLEFKARTYRQSSADFFQDLFPYFDASGEEFRARDKEVSRFDSYTLGLGATYDLSYAWPLTDRQSVGLYWDFIFFDYHEFRNPLLSRSEDGQTPQHRVGEEPSYSMQANVVRLFLSIFF